MVGQTLRFWIIPWNIDRVVPFFYGQTLRFWNIPWNIDRVVPFFYVFSLVKQLFGEQQMRALADYIRAALMKKFNQRQVG